MLHIREWVSFFFGFRAAEGKKALAEVIQTGEEHHADEHGHIIARTHRSVGKQAQTQRFCDAVGDQVADGDVRREAHDLTRAALPALERKMLVEEKAQDAREHVVCRRGHPIRAVGKVIQSKHDARADKRVEDADEQKLPQLRVKERAQALQSSASRSSSSVSMR